MIINALKSPYRFSIKEILKPDPSLSWRMPKLNVISQNQSFYELDIQGLHFFWPAEYDLGGLTWIYKEVFTPSISNPHAYEFKNIKINKDDWLIDGGACEGFFTAYAIKRKARVLVIEPIDRLCEALSLTFRVEISQGKVIILNGCLGKYDGTTNVLLDKKSISSTTMANNSNGSVKVFTIDNILSEGIIPKLDFIKMDIEGAEIDALSGSKKTLKACKPRLSIAVYHSLYNAKIAKKLIRSQRADYNIKFRGLYSWDTIIPRPYMLFGY